MLPGLLVKGAGRNAIRPTWSYTSLIGLTFAGVTPTQSIAKGMSSLAADLDVCAKIFFVIFVVVAYTGLFLSPPLV